MRFIFWPPTSVDCESERGQRLGLAGMGGVGRVEQRPGAEPSAPLLLFLDRVKLLRPAVCVTGLLVSQRCSRFL